MASDHHDTQTHRSDMAAAYTGLIVGALCLLVLLSGIVKWTNSRYAHEKPAAEATK